ncbi:MAG: hypothetical protein HKN23_21060 [Verrucomicrobiales bacterium]|nr:hypothetical protein [Verrucomicrobiales bacterium]
MTSLPEHYIDTPEDLVSYLDELTDGGTHHPDWCAIDTEADSMHSYETKLCLIQFAVKDSLAIFDPLAIQQPEIQPLLDFLDQVDVVWMHGADYDMSMFRRTYDWIPRCVWDTQTAARLLGVEQFGLANLLDQEFGVKVSKQSQKADWSRRPLTEKMQDYAYNDVRYLLEMARRFIDRLKEKGRFEWFIESCEAAQTLAAEREEKTDKDQWRITGWGNLDRRGLAFLRALWKWRDDECRRLDRPAFKLVSNAEIVSLSEKLQAGEKVDPPPYLRPGIARRLLKTVTETRNLDPSEYPVKHRRTGGIRLQIDEDRLQSLKSHRNRQAKQLGIDPTLIAPRMVLERLASSNLEQEQKDGLLLGWQRELMGL